MFRYRLLKACLTFLILGYFAAALVLPNIFHIREIYPLFSWNLFGKVPSVPKQDYALFVTEEGNPTARPDADLRSTDQFALQQERIEARKLIRRLGQAIRQQNGEEESRMRQLLEAQYLNDVPEGAVYVVIHRTFDPIQAVKTGAYDFKVLKEYKKGSL